MKRLFLEILFAIILISSYGAFIFLFYQRKLDGLKSGQDDKKYNSELVFSQEFDSVFMGTSLSQNFRPSEFDQLFHADSIKLTFAGGCFGENLQLLNMILRFKKIKFIVLEITDFSFENERPFPADLYGESDFPRFRERLRTIFSLQELFVVLHILRQRKTGKLTRDDIYSWKNEYVCNEKIFAKYIHDNLTSTCKIEKVINDGLLEKVQGNVSKNLVPFLEMSHDIEVLAFFPPIHIMSYGEGRNTTLAIKKMQSDVLLQFPNVRLFDFGIAREIIIDANRYRDLMHYDAEVNSWMLQKMNDNDYRMTKENQQDYLQRLDNMIVSFDWTKEYQRLKKILQ